MLASAQFFYCLGLSMNLNAYPSLQIDRLKKPYKTVSEWIAHLTHNDYQFRVINHVEQDKDLLRTSVFESEQALLVLGHLKIEIAALPDGFLDEWNVSQQPLGKFCKERYPFERVLVFEHTESKTLTVMSHLVIDKKRVGLCWEIFDLYVINKIQKREVISNENVDDSQFH